MIGKKQLYVVGLVCIVGVGVYLLPKQPKSVRENVPTDIDHAEHSKIDRAVSLVQSGSNPMEGIMLLREVLAEDSTNIEALLYLGLFSVQSGQLEKARERFQTILSYDSDHLDAHWQLGQLDFDAEDFSSSAEHFSVCASSGIQEYENAWFFMGRAKELLGDNPGALEAYMAFRPLTEDTVIIKRLDEFITRLDNNIK